MPVVNIPGVVITQQATQGRALEILGTLYGRNFFVWFRCGTATLWVARHRVASTYAQDNRPPTGTEIVSAIKELLAQLPSSIREGRRRPTSHITIEVRL